MKTKEDIEEPMVYFFFAYYAANSKYAGVMLRLAQWILGIDNPDTRYLDNWLNETKNTFKETMSLENYKGFLEKAKENTTKA